MLQCIIIFKVEPFNQSFFKEEHIQIVFVFLSKGIYIDL